MVANEYHAAEFINFIPVTISGVAGVYGYGFVYGANYVRRAYQAGGFPTADAARRAARRRINALVSYNRRRYGSALAV